MARSQLRPFWRELGAHTSQHSSHIKQFMGVDSEPGTEATHLPREGLEQHGTMLKPSERNTINLKGSSKIVTDFFAYAVNR